MQTFNQMVTNLNISNNNLLNTYDSTLEGWSKALEMRDKETLGHTSRVTELTMKIAKEMGIPEARMLQVKRGSLLHDIGKMGIPDSILLKPGKLDQDELAVMRRHPHYAYEMLKHIDFLQPALTIPYFHHEYWDGTGYPRGLKGVEIPLEARIFAIVDVWDALSSDRPYRKALPPDQVIDIIKSEIGTHFDPEVGRVFLEMYEKGKF
jgi:putative nucleotidyltransferase with HDIG domain